MTVLLAVRVRKARKGGTCGLCPAPVLVGQQIGLVPGYGWAHVDCILAAEAA